MRRFFLGRSHAALSFLFRALTLLAFAFIWTHDSVGQEPLAPLPQSASHDTGSGTTAPANVDIDALIQKLEDPQARQEIIAVLRAAQSPEAQQEQGMHSVDAEDVVLGLSEVIDSQINDIVEAATDIADTVMALPELWTWLRYQVENEFRRTLWLRIATGLAWVFAAAFAGRWIASRLIVRPRRSIDLKLLEIGRPAPLMTLQAILIDLTPLLAFVLIASIGLRSQILMPATIFVGQSIWMAVAFGRFLRIASNRILCPEYGKIRIVPINTRWAGRLRAWILRIGGVVIYGHFGLRAADRLGLPPALDAAISHVLFIVVAGMITAFLLSAREAIAHVLLRQGERVKSPYLKGLVPWDLLASYGYILAILLVWTHYVVWAVGLPGGFSFLFRASTVTVAAFFVAQTIILWITGGSAEDAQEKRPAEDEEEGRDQPPMDAGVTKAFVKLAIKAAAVLVVLEAWDAGIIAWFSTETGRTALQGLARVGVVVGGAVLVWAAINRVVTAYLTARDEAGYARYSNRSRTLATIARNVLLVVIALFAVATVLSEIGIQTAPLLAGAGVVGLAIGFGSQKLVQDIITGMFILLGDTIRVGDVVDLGGRSGVVEALSMRTVTLRGYDGNVHTIPFSSIDTVTNMTKDFSFWVFEIGIAYDQNVDEVMHVLRDIDSQLRRDWPYRRLILEPLEIAGVDRFGDSAIVIKARVKTKPGEQWRVGREFNRRIKAKFDELGIEIPFPHRTIYFAADKARKGKDIPAGPEQLAAGTAVRYNPQLPQGAMADRA